MSWSESRRIVLGPGQKEIRIKVQKGELDLGDLETQNIAETVRTSRKIITDVITLVDSWHDNDSALLKRNMGLYFKTDPEIGPSVDERGRVLGKLKLVSNGINGKLELKVAVPSTDRGSVNWMPTGLGALSPRHTFGTHKGLPVSMGAIHIGRNIVKQSEMRIITFIHEASHKYADTYDYGESGYMKESGASFREEGLKKPQALNNADSYAYFCYMTALDKGFV